MPLGEAPVPAPSFIRLHLSASPVKTCLSRERMASADTAFGVNLDEYAGRPATVAGEVEEVIGRRAFVLGED